jgi:hypothetical protein
MTVRAYNKVTRIWTSTEDGSELTPPGDWIVNPTFEDEAFAQLIGQTYWTFNGTIIETPTQAEYDALILAEAKAQKWEEIKAERDRRQQTGGTFVDPNWFHSDPVSRQQQMGLVMMQDNMPTGIMWKTMSGSFVEMTPDLAEAIFNGAVLTDQVAFANAEAHRTALNALTTANAAANYDFSTGWPAVYTP